MLSEGNNYTYYVSLEINNCSQYFLLLMTRRQVLELIVKLSMKKGY